MRVLLNILWFIFGGFIVALSWLLSGVLCCITVVGIPLGLQCFKFAKLAVAPFGKDIRYGGGNVKLIANVLWIVLLGWEMALSEVILGVGLCCTIIGIPLGLQSFKFAKLALMPFGADIVKAKKKKK